MTPFDEVVDRLGAPDPEATRALHAALEHAIEALDGFMVALDVSAVATAMQRVGAMQPVHDPIAARDSLWAILERPEEALALRDALWSGRVVGVSSELCVLAVIGRARGADYHAMRDRYGVTAIEAWAMQYMHGSTPERNVYAAMLDDWLKQWLERWCESDTPGAPVAPAAPAAPADLVDWSRVRCSVRVAIERGTRDHAVLAGCRAARRAAVLRE